MDAFEIGLKVVHVDSLSPWVPFRRRFTFTVRSLPHETAHSSHYYPEHEL